MGGSSKNAESLRERIEKKTALVGVIGLGYVGLPLAHTFVQAGFRVLGFDIDAQKVETLAAGRSYIRHLPGEWIQSWQDAGRFSATSEMARLGEADAILMCVPTPLTPTREPDLSFVESTCRQIAASLRAGQLVVLESTTYPGTTRDVVRPLLETSGLAAGRDFFLAYSPEREDPGNVNYSARNIPKVVGGIDSTSLELANSLYAGAVVATVPVANCEIAEASKILENTYRSVNIALVNELKLLFERMGLNVWEVIEAAKTKPFGFQPFYPGPGLGGHCIPIDPFYLSWVARKYGQTTRFIELAGEINSAMPAHVVRRVVEALNAHAKPLRGSQVTVLGLAYKRDVDDNRESPAFELMRQLLEGGAVVRYNDPYFPQMPSTREHAALCGRVPDSVELTAEFLATQDCVLIATDHSAYDYEFIVRHAPLVVDSRNATRHVAQGREKIFLA